MSGESEGESEQEREKKRGAAIVLPHNSPFRLSSFCVCVCVYLGGY